MLDEVVVIVRVTLQEVSTVAAPMIIRAIAAHKIFMMIAFIVMSFFSPTDFTDLTDCRCLRYAVANVCASR